MFKYKFQSIKLIVPAISVVFLKIGHCVDLYEVIDESFYLYYVCYH